MLRNRETFEGWLDAYGRAWETGDPEAATSEEEGVAHWSASFMRLTARTPLELDGILLAKLDAGGHCMEFRKWWHPQEE